MLEIDGHDFGQILAACDEVRAGTGGAVPTAILAHTVKGRGVSFTEGRSEWHARPASLDEAATARAGAGARRGGRAVTKPQRDVWAETLIELAATNPDVLVMDADLATSTKADRFAAAYPDRFLQMGIAEQVMVGRGRRASRSPDSCPGSARSGSSSRRGPWTRCGCPWPRPTPT